MDKLTDIEIVGDLWRRRVEWMWSHWNAEYAPSEKVDIEWLDEQIDKEEEAERANPARKAP